MLAHTRARAPSSTHARAPARGAAPATRRRVAVCRASSDGAAGNGAPPGGNGEPAPTPSTSGGAAAVTRWEEPEFGWRFSLDAPPKWATDKKIRQVPVNEIRRPLGRTRANDEAKVQALMKSIAEIGLQEPIDVLDVEGVIYGFSGCHRYEAHQRLGLPTILCRVRKATKQVLKMHMM